MNWLLNPRQAAEQWVLGIVNRVLAERDRQARLSADIVSQHLQNYYSAAASATIPPLAAPLPGLDGLPATP